MVILAMNVWYDNVIKNGDSMLQNVSSIFIFFGGG